MSVISNLSEKQRGWFYFILSLVFILILVVMFVIAVLNGDDLSDWWIFIVGGLGLSGSGLASRNTNRGP